jgi:hypothetical protein
MCVQVIADQRCEERPSNRKATSCAQSVLVRLGRVVAGRQLDDFATTTDDGGQ